MSKIVKQFLSFFLSAVLILSSACVLSLPSVADEDDCIHLFSSFVYTKHATEDEAGVKRRVCDSCGLELETIVIPKLSLWQNPFYDVAKENWYYNAVRWANATELIYGMTDNSFASDENMTRAMLVTLLGRYEGVSGAIFSIDSFFTDTASGEWYSLYIVWAKRNHIVGGYADGTFKPDRNITRQELAALFYNYVKFKGIDVETGLDEGKFNSFADSAEVAEWAKPQMLWAVSVGLINGSDNRLNPTATATRAEVAQLLYNYCCGC